MHWTLLLSALALPGSPGAAYFADAQADGSVRLSLRSGSTESPVAGTPEGVEWRRFDLRAASLAAPEGAGGVLELKEPVPRLQVRADFQLFAYSGIATEASGLGVVGSGGVTLLLSSDDSRYRILNEGTSLSTGGAYLGFVVRGSLAEQVHVVDVRGRIPDIHTVDVPGSFDKIEPRTLSLTESALFFGAQSKEGWFVYRAPLAPSRPQAPLLSETVAGPFVLLREYFAASEGGVAFLAGKGPGELDVFAVPSSGAAVNVTRSPGNILTHSPQEPRLAISADATSVSYDLRAGSEPETYLHDVYQPGPAGAFQITADQRFNPYIDQESLIFFDGNGNLVFAAGHDLVTLDVYRVDRAQPSSPINLTRTGSNLNPPFLTKGTLAVASLHLAPDGLALVSATGFPGSSTTQPVLAAANVGTGQLFFVDAGLQSASGFVSAGTDLFFAASPPSGGRAFYQLTAGQLTQVGVATTGLEPRTLFLSGGATLVALPGTGIVSLAAGGSQVLVPFTEPTAGAAVDSSGRYLVYGRGAAGAAAYMVTDLTTGLQTTLADGPIAGELLALAEALDPATFFRGDSNADGAIDISDAVGTLLYLFRGQATVRCADAADADDDGTLTLTDPVRTLLYLFRGGAPLPQPASVRGLDPTPDALDCTAPTP